MYVASEALATVLAVGRGGGRGEGAIFFSG